MEQVLSDLKLIASILPGKTLSVTYKNVVDHNSWYTSFSRSYNRENRDKTIDYIKSIFSNALNMYETDNSTELIVSIEAAIVGLENLKSTYPTKLEEIDMLLDYVQFRFGELLNHHRTVSITEYDNSFLESINDIDQKIRSNMYTEEEIQQTQSLIEQMVEASNRMYIREEIKEDSDRDVWSNDIVITVPISDNLDDTLDTCSNTKSENISMDNKYGDDVFDVFPEEPKNTNTVQSNEYINYEAYTNGYDNSTEKKPPIKKRRANGEREKETSIDFYDCFDYDKHYFKEDLSTVKNIISKLFNEWINNT